MAEREQADQGATDAGDPPPPATENAPPPASEPSDFAIPTDDYIGSVIKSR